MPKVGIVMGSDSDLKVMSKAAATLEKFGIDYEMTIISAHRMPDVFLTGQRQPGSERNQSDHQCRNGSSICRAKVALFWMPVIGIPMSGKNLEDGCALLFYRSDTRIQGNSCHRRRNECGNSCSKDACNVRSGTS